MLTHLLALLLGGAAGAGLLAVPWAVARRRAVRLDRENERLVSVVFRLRLERDAARQDAAMLRLRHAADGGPVSLRPADLARVSRLDAGGEP